MNRSFLALLVGCVLTVSAHAQLVPQPDLWAYWNVSNASGIASVDHSPWQALLDRYVVTEHPSGIHRFRYADVTPDDRQALRRYIGSLAALDPRAYNQAEQQAYWINLYNAITVSLVVDAYPVKSIRKINGGLFGLGPWNDEVVTVQRKPLTLNDIEHRILRPIYTDPRVHYAVNCASLGCPNLAAQAYRGVELEAQLDAAARAFVGHPRGVELTDKRLRLSSIYKWFADDFGNDEAGLLAHLAQYAEPGLAQRLRAFDGRIKYDYDWDLNEP